MAADKEDGGGKWGATAVRGYLQKGLEELRAAAPLADSPIAQPTNYAMPGMSTPGEVADARREEPEMAAGEGSVLAGKLEQIGPPGPDDPGRDDRSKGMDRE
jgi:hypothetical protein